MFKISRNTIDLWLKRRETTGSVAAIRDYRRSPQSKIADIEQFRVFAQQQGHLTQKDMAAQWAEPVSDVTISKALRRIGFTRKKRVMATKNGMTSNEKPS